MEKEEKESTFSKLRENATKFDETTGSPMIDIAKGGYKMYKFGSAIKNDSVGDFFLDEASSSVASEVGVIVGAAIGSIIPGVGTAVGVTVGGAIGGFFGGFVRELIDNL